MNKFETMVLFDLDGTIIDNGYQMTEPGLAGAIARAQDSGITIGLSSDTPHSQLDWWKKELGMNGPIIAEKGAVVELNGSITYDLELRSKVETSIAMTLDYLGKRQDTLLITGNATQNVKRELPVDASQSTIVYLNTLSMCSLRYFVRQGGRDGTRINDELTQQLYAEIKQFEPAITNKSVDNNPDFGLVIIGDERMNKRYGARQMLAHCSVNRLLMVGNSMGDYIGEDIAEQYAVANATDDYIGKSICLEKAFTGGCIEILDRLS